MAVCEECGAVYAAIEKSDGSLAPIGRLSGCRCGSTEFSELDADAMLEESDEE